VTVPAGVVFLADRDNVVFQPAADVTVERIDDLVTYDLPALVGDAGSARP